MCLRSEAHYTLGASCKDVDATRLRVRVRCSHGLPVKPLLAASVAPPAPLACPEALFQTKGRLQVEPSKMEIPHPPRPPAPPLETPHGSSWVEVLGSCWKEASSSIEF